MSIRNRLARMRRDIRSAYRSEETEAPFDRIFTKPIGYLWARLFLHLGWTPNMVTLLAMGVGFAGGTLFYFQSAWINLIGILLVLSANILDSTDGQVARLTGSRSTLGRILDALSTSVWFAAIYCALAFRLAGAPIPFTGGRTWGGAIWFIAFLGAFLGHQPQCMLADYYRNIHLYFLGNGQDSELQHSRDIARMRARLPWKGARFQKLYLYFYAVYTYLQELSTPAFQKLFTAFEGADTSLREDIRKEYLEKSRRFIQLTNVLTFNARFFVLTVCVMIGHPFLYFPIELIGFGALLIFTRSRYEEIAADILRAHDLTQSANAPEKRNKYPIFFFSLGVIGIIVMLSSTDLGAVDWSGTVLRLLPVWLPGILGVWAIIYFMHTLAYRFILGPDGKKVKLTFLIKMTLSGFAMNAVTPVGFAGGEPYRIMELTPFVGVEKATSTTLTFTVMHTISHVLFWFTGALCYFLLGCPGGTVATILFLIVLAACGYVVYVFVRSGQRGLVLPALTLLSRIPKLGRYFTRLMDTQHDTLAAIDRDMGAFHTRVRDYWCTLSLEYAGRLMEAVEFFLIFNVLGEHVSFAYCALSLATASLLGNLMFIIPMQVGSREGGMALALSWAGLASSLSVTAALLARIREIIYLAIGVSAMLIKNGPVATVRSEEKANEEKADQEKANQEAETRQTNDQ